MEASKAKILILEDDPTLGAGLQKVFEKEGYEVYHATKPDEAFAQIKKNLFAMVLVDCLLPQMPGVDFIENVRRDHLAFTSPVILMSGIYTDRQFVKEALARTQAVEFIKKPFEMTDIIEVVKKYVASNTNEKSANRKDLFSLFNRPKVSNREKRKAIESLEEIHGFDLPFIYSILVESKSSGYLNIVSNKGEVSGISFSNGSIVSVDIPDKDTYLGKLLIDKGYVEVDDLNDILADQSPRKLGQKLIQSNLLSPHAFDLAIAEQMNIRLSRTIVDSSVRINFVSNEVESTGVEINSDSLVLFLHDWIISKISLDWLKTHFLQWADFNIQKSPLFAPENPAFQMPLVQSLGGLLQEFNQGMTVNQIVNSNKYQEDAFYKALYFLFCRGLFIFSGTRTSETSDERIKTLNKMLDQFKTKNKFEIFEVMGGRKKDIKEDEVTTIYYDFLKFLGPRPDSQQEALCKTYDEIYHLTESVYNLMKNPKEREAYEQSLAKKELEKKIRIQSEYEEAKNLINIGQPVKALTLLKSVMATDSNLPQIKLYLALAKVKSIEHGADRKAVLNDLNFDLMQIPPEEKYNSLFPFVNGLFHRARGDFESARKNFEKCLVIEPNMISARRELSSMAEVSKAGKQDFMNRDLKDMVAGFFKKK